MDTSALKQPGPTNYCNVTAIVARSQSKHNSNGKLNTIEQTRMAIRAMAHMHGVSITV